jgi:hypothetical protein
VSYGACSSVYVAFIDALFPLRYPGRRHSVRSVAEIIEALTLYMVNIVRQYKVRMVTKSVMQFWTFSIGRSISLHRGVCSPTLNSPAAMGRHYFGESSASIIYHAFGSITSSD